MNWNFDDNVEAMIANIVEFFPELLGALLILIIGFIIAKLLEKGTDTILEKTGFDRAVSRGGVDDALARSGTTLDPSSLVARLIFWIIVLVTILMAANVLGLTAVAAMFEELVTYIPNVIAAVVILVLAMVLGEFVKDLIVTSAGKVEGVSLLARVAKAAIVVLAVFMALDQLQVAEDIVETAFTLLLGAVALAVGLAFGLGNRELAGEHTRNWVEHGRKKASQIRSDPRPPPDPRVG